MHIQSPFPIFSIDRPKARSYSVTRWFGSSATGYEVSHPAFATDGTLSRVAFYRYACSIGFDSEGALRQHTTDGLLLVQVPPAFDLELRRGRSTGSEGYARQIRGQIPPPGNGLH